MWASIRMAAAMAAVLFVAAGCGKTSIPGPHEPEGEPGALVARHFQLVSEGPAVRSYIDELRIKWDSGDDSRLYYNDGTGFRTAESSGTTISEEGRRAAFDFELMVAPEAKGIELCSVCPAGAVMGENPADAALLVPQNQRPASDSYDPEAAVILGQYASGVSLAQEHQIGYRLASALTKMTVKGIPQGERIVSVEVKAGTGICGSVSADLTKAGVGPVPDKSLLRIGYGDDVNTSDCWMSTWPVASGTGLDISVYTPGKLYSKSIALGADIVTDKLNVISVNMEGCGSDNELVGRFLLASIDSFFKFYVYGPDGALETDAFMLDEVKKSLGKDLDTYVWEISKAPFGYSLKNGSAEMNVYIETYLAGHKLSYVDNPDTFLNITATDGGVILLIEV